MDTKQALELLTQLQEKAVAQGRKEFIDALDTAIASLKKDLEAGETKKDSDFDLSSNPADQLVKLANQVRADSSPLGDSRRRGAAIYLARLAKN